MKRTLLTTAICATLLMGSAAYAQDTTTPDQTPATPAKDKDARKLDTITVTGSLIPKSEKDTSSPVITITSQDIQREGFRNVYDAIRAVPTATGSVQDSQTTNSFTPGANTVSLLGLDPSFTLVLMNGRPLADYPLLYNSNSNFVDLATIPTYLVDRIEILTGNQSAIYGSAAIAGVVNIILKKHLEGVDVRVRGGTYTDGGGSSEKFTVAGGHSTDKWDVLFGLEYSKQDPIFGFDRSYTDSYLDNPNPTGRVAERDVVAIDAFTGKYIDPGAAACAPLTGLFAGQEKYSFRPGRGFYCGSLNGAGYTTFLNNRKDINTYLSGTFHLNDTTDIYADLLYNHNTVQYTVGGTAFWSNSGLVYDLDTGHLDSTLQRIFAPEELGSEADGFGKSSAYVFDVGIRGSIGQSSWDYDAYFHRSGYKTDYKQRRLLNDKANAFFLGPQDGTDPYGYGYPAYHIIQTGHVYAPFTPAQFDSISDFVASRSSTYNQEGNITVTNTHLFQLPAGPVGIAALVEAGDQYWNNPIDPRVTAGDFFGSGGTSGQGTRKRQAAAVEVNVPIFKMLTATGSARYDKYSVPGNSQGKATYKVGLEFRPVESLLFRGNYATAFRAPDMGYIFSGGSSFFTNADDFYNCRRVQGDNPTSCNPPYGSVQFQGFQKANKDLKYITAKSFGYGVVWAPTADFSLNVDYYNVKISNEVQPENVVTILSKEADCRLGHDSNGNPVDLNSPSCQQALAQVHRNPLNAPFNPGGLISVDTLPINIANEQVAGINAQASYRWDAGRLGKFIFGASFNRALTHRFQANPADQVENLLDLSGFSTEFRDIGSGSLTWIKGPFSTTLYGIRYGRSASIGLPTVSIAPWILYNASVSYNRDNFEITLSGNNIFNKRPPFDPTGGNISPGAGYPYYNTNNFNSFGRLIMLEVGYKFGAKDQ